MDAAAARVRPRWVSLAAASVALPLAGLLEPAAATVVVSPHPPEGNITLDACWAEVLGQSTVNETHFKGLYLSNLCDPTWCSCHPRLPTWTLVTDMLGYSFIWLVSATFLGIVVDRCGGALTESLSGRRRARLDELERISGWRAKLHWIDCLFNASKVGAGVVRLLLSLILCILFVIKAYKQGQPNWMQGIEFFVLLCFSLEYCVGFVFATSHTEFALKPERVAMILSSIMSIYGVCGTWLTLNFLQGITVYESIKDILDVWLDNKNYASLAKQAATFAVIVFIFACTIFAVELLGEVESFDYYANPMYAEVEGALPMTLSEAVYFTMITVSTVGYGDFSPSTVVGRMITMFFILVGIAFFTTVTHDVGVAYRYLRSGFGSYPKMAGIPHCVVCGDLSAESLGPLFQEFFSESRRESAPKVFNRHCELVLLSPMPQDEQLEKLLQQYTGLRVRPRVHFLRGSALEEKDLKRACVESAVACFLLSQRLVDDEDDEDANTILKMSSIIRYNPGVDCILALCKLTNQEHAVVAGAKIQNIVCFREMRLKLLARATECEGFASLITNLITSRDDFSLNKHPALKGDAPEDVEYFEGMSQKINRVSIDHIMELFTDEQKYLAGGDRAPKSIKFEDGLLTVYARSGGLLMGLIKEESDGKTQVTLAPRVAAEINPEMDKTVRACVILSNYGAEGYLGGWQDGAALLQKFHKDMVHIKSYREKSAIRAAEENTHATVHSDVDASHDGPKTYTWHDPLHITPAAADKENYHWESDLRIKVADGDDSMTDGEQRLLEHNRWRYASEYQAHGENFMQHVKRIQKPLKSYAMSPELETLPAPAKKDMAHHILVVGTPPDGMINFVQPMRLNPRWMNKAIVFYGPKTPSPTSYRQLLHAGLAGGVFFVRGGLRVEEIEQCCLDRAHRIAIITPSDPSNRRVDREKVEPQLADSRQIFLARYFAGKYPNARVITEIATDQSVKYFDHRKAPLHKPDAVAALLYSNAYYRSGRLAPVSTVYNLVVGVYYNMVLQKTDKNVKEASWSTATVIRKLVNGVESAIFQKRVPKKFIGKKYADLLEHELLQNRAITIGLFRKHKAGAAYVYTNPGPDVIIRDTDKVFLLTKKSNHNLLRRSSVHDLHRFSGNGPKGDGTDVAAAASTVDGDVKAGSNPGPETSEDEIQSARAVEHANDMSTDDILAAVDDSGDGGDLELSSVVPPGGVS